MVQALGICLVDGGFALAKVPSLVRQVIRREAWRERILAQTGQRVTFDHFEAFIETPPLDGLGATMALLRNICRDDPKALDAIDRVTQRTRGGKHQSNGNNIPIESRPEGTTRAKALRRLRTARPDLHRDVLNGKKSAHAAMIEAGFRRKTVTVPVDDLEALITTLRRVLGRRWQTFLNKVRT